MHKLKNKKIDLTEGVDSLDDEDDLKVLVSSFLEKLVYSLNRTRKSRKRMITTFMEETECTRRFRKMKKKLRNPAGTI